MMVVRPITWAIALTTLSSCRAARLERPCIQLTREPGSAHPVEAAPVPAALAAGAAGSHALGCWCSSPANGLQSAPVLGAV